MRKRNGASRRRVPAETTSAPRRPGVGPGREVTVWMAAWTWLGPAAGSGRGTTFPPSPGSTRSTPRAPHARRPRRMRGRSSSAQMGEKSSSVRRTPAGPYLAGDRSHTASCHPRPAAERLRPLSARDAIYQSDRRMRIPGGTETSASTSGALSAQSVPISGRPDFIAAIRALSCLRRHHTASPRPERMTARDVQTLHLHALATGVDDVLDQRFGGGVDEQEHIIRPALGGPPRAVNLTEAPPMQKSALRHRALATLASAGLACPARSSRLRPPAPRGAARQAPTVYGTQHPDALQERAGLQGRPGRQDHREPFLSGRWATRSSQAPRARSEPCSRKAKVSISASLTKTNTTATTPPMSARSPGKFSSIAVRHLG